MIKKHLPPRFEFSHEYCLYLHDRLVDLIVYGEKEGFFNTTISFKNKDEAIEFSDPDLDIFDWLEKQQRGDIVGEILLKSVFPALLSDFCHFIFESLSCSAKGKLSVCYALLRKPLKENLHYLEWLLADPEGLLNTFYNQESIELSFRRIGTPERIRNVVKNAISRTINATMFNPDYIYELRFDKTCPYGFEGLWNHAMHLITTKQPIHTEKQNFNFIFSSETDRHRQWEQLYSQLPLLLFYTAEICEVLIALIRKEPMPDAANAILHRSIGFLLWGTEINKIFGDFKVHFGALKELVLDCPKCMHKIQPDIERIKKLYYYQKIKCPNCRTKLSYFNFVKAA